MRRRLSRPRSGRRTAERGERTRERILDAALREFAQHGFAGTSVRRITRRARVQLPTLYHYFASKEALYEHAQERVHAEAREVMQGVFSNQAKEFDLRVTTRDAVGRMFDFMLAHKSYVQLGYRNRLERRSQPSSVRRFMGDWVQAIEGLLKSAEAAGLIRPVDPTAFVVTVDSLIHAHIVCEDAYRSMLGKGLDDPEVAARAREHVIQVVLRTLGLDDAAATAGR